MADKYTPRLRSLYDAEIAKAMTEKFVTRMRSKCPRSKDRAQHGRGRSDAGQEEGHVGREEMETGSLARKRYHQGEEVDRAVQAA